MKENEGDMKNKEFMPQTRKINSSKIATIPKAIYHFNIIPN